MAFRTLCLLAVTAVSTLATPIETGPATHHLAARQMGSDPNYCVGLDYPCTKGVLILGARGGDENSTNPLGVSLKYGDLQGMEDIAKPLIAKAGGYCRGIPYAAAGPPFYGNSVDVGTMKTQDIIKNYVDKCGADSRIILLGYSAGAQVHTEVMIGQFPAIVPTGFIPALSSKYQKNIIGAALFGNPAFRHGIFPIDAGNSTTDGPLPPPTFTYNNWNKQYGNRVRNYCQDTDASCANGGLKEAPIQVHLNALKFFKNDAITFLSQFL